MSEEVKADAFIAKAKSLGYSIFYGSIDSSYKPHIYWDNDQGDYVKFLKLGRDLGISILIVDRFILYDEDLDNMKLNPEDFTEKQRDEIQEINNQIEQFRKYAGKTGVASLSWVYEGAVFSYVESTDWAQNYFDFRENLEDRLDEIYEEEESELNEAQNELKQ